jgi:hypothetical protein
VGAEFDADRQTDREGHDEVISRLSQFL